MKSEAERTFASIVASYMEAHEPQPIETGLPTLTFLDIMQEPVQEPVQE